MKCEEDDPIYRKVAKQGNDSNLILQVTCHCVVVMYNRVLHEISGCLFRVKMAIYPSDLCCPCQHTSPPLAPTESRSYLTPSAAGNKYWRQAASLTPLFTTLSMIKRIIHSFLHAHPRVIL